jgi:hypothetical protein
VPAGRVTSDDEATEVEPVLHSQSAQVIDRSTDV